MNLPAASTLARKPKLQSERQLADDGKVILMGHLNYLKYTVCDRIAVFCEGRLTQILTNRET
ncbi:hypothetical protein QT332_07335 [Escherichia coli]|nr:hypothetical protein [Escherichia coli]MDM4917943.1 hypothetical protein [Escherichia coli]